MPVYIIGAGGPDDKASIHLATRRNTFIRNERRREMAPNMLKEGADLWRRERPNARLRSASAVYNCMGMVFASRRTWIDPAELDLILKEDEYRPVTELAQVEIGDIVVYRDRSDHRVTHVGIIVHAKRDVEKGAYEITVISKWGKYGEYIHLMEDVPFILGEPAEYWTDRRQMA